MTPEQQDLLLKADRKLASAKVSLREEFPEDTVSRAYYSMFYVAQALLLSVGFTGKSHRGLISAFGENLVITGRVAAESHRSLINAENLRKQADYGPSNAVTHEQAQRQITSAEQFLQLGNHLIAKPHYQNLYEQYAQQVGNVGTQTQVNYQIAIRAFQAGLNYQDTAYVLAQSPQCQELKPNIAKAKEYVDNILRQAQLEAHRSQDSDIDLDLDF